MRIDLRTIYDGNMRPEELANAVLESLYPTGMPSLPIDPFAIMRDAGIVYRFMNFRNLEGIYLVPENDDDEAFVGININRPITRQRYTAAHELCHHIKDRIDEACKINDRRNIERYAEQFAAALLMPDAVFHLAAQRYADPSTGLVSMNNALLLSIEFGVSYRSCANRLYYQYHMLEVDGDLNKAIQRFRPDRRKEALGYDTEDIRLLYQAIDSYEFYYQMGEDLFWYRYKNDFIYNENRMEGVQLDAQEVAEIITDLRMNGSDSEFCNERYEDIIQVMGHSAIYDYLATTNDRPTIYSLLNLNKRLFQYAPYPDESGKTRDMNNLVLGTKFETLDYRDVPGALIQLDPYFSETIRRSAELSVSGYIDRVARIHHRITQIHPFRDGNGRSSRALLNWMFKIKGLPPIYIRLENKEQYYRALSIADKSGEYKELNRVLIHELFRTTVRLMQHR